MRVRLAIESGPVPQREFDFEEPGGFTFGREEDCTCVMPQDDNTFSRHHFILEINPPNVMLKDLGSLNGTFVNGTKHGGRAKDVPPEDAAASAPVALRDGDAIKAGRCELKITIEAPVVCVDCGKEVPRAQRKAAEFIGGTYLCQACRDKEEKKRAQKKPVREVKPAELELNVEQRKKAEETPAAVVEEFIRMLLRAKAQDRPMAIQGYSDMKQVGVGGFGVVYVATRISDGSTVAIKTMLQTRKPPQRQIEMFEREKEIAEQLRHPNIVHCGKSSQWKDLHFIEMEYMDAGSVWDLMKKTGKLPLKTAAPIMVQALEGLAYAHKAMLTVTTKAGKKTVNGVVHRDLKPPNILLSGQPGRWTAKLSDFGLAKAFSEAGMTKGAITCDPRSCCGSPPYMAPEHLVNYKYVKPPTDVFEIAATFYHMLTGQIVWPMKPGVEPIKAVLEGAIISIRKLDPSISSGVAEVFDRALARDQKQRYSDAGEMLEAMSRAL